MYICLEEGARVLGHDGLRHQLARLEEGERLLALPHEDRDAAPRGSRREMGSTLLGPLQK